MKISHDWVAIVIAALSFIISAVSLITQTYSRYNAFYRMDNSHLNVFSPVEGVDNLNSIIIHADFYNLGNRPISITDAELSFIKRPVSASDWRVPEICPEYEKYENDRSQVRYITKIYDASSATVRPFLAFSVSPNSIESRNLIILPFAPGELGPIYFEGVLCARITGTDWRGRTTGATQAVALLKIDLPRQRPDLTEINFNSVTNTVNILNPSRPLILLDEKKIYMSAKESIKNQAPPLAGF